MSQVSSGSLLSRSWAIRSDLVDHIKPRTSGQIQIHFDQLRRLLDKSGVQYHVVPKEAWDRYIAENRPEKILPAPRINLAEVVCTTIWQDPHVKVEFARENGRTHLLVSPQIPIPFEDAAILAHDKECVAVQRTAMRTASAFARVFGSPDYAQSFVPRNGTFSIELFPAGSQPNKLDLLRKDRRNVFWLTQGQFGSCELPPVDERTLAVEMAKSCNSREETIPLFSDFSVDNWGLAAAYRADTMLAIWSSQGLPIVPISSPKPYAPREIPAQAKKLGECPFCGDAVEKESIAIKEREHHVLFNPVSYFGQCLWDEETKSWKPNPEGRHHMVIPKPHGIGRTDAQIMERMAITARIQACFKQVHPDATPHNFEQIGPAAGQTLAHQHSHVIAFSPADVPEYLYHMLKEDPIVGNDSERQRGFFRPSQALVTAYHQRQRPGSSSV